MTRWQRRARLVIAIGAVAFALVVLFALKYRAPQDSGPAAAGTDPAAIVEVTGGRVERFKLSRQDVSVSYERQITYSNGSTKLMGVTITADERAGGRRFTVTGREADIGQNESTMQLTGDVQLAASDGMSVRTERATYSDKDGVVRAMGPVEFSRGRMTGSGFGMTHDSVRDVLTILDQTVVHVAADERGAGAAEILSGSATFARREKTIRFDRDVKLQREGQTIAGDVAVLHLTPDEKQIQLMELRGRSGIAMDKASAGDLRGLNSRDMDLKYGSDGQTLEHAVLTGDAAIVLAGAPGAADREIKASTIETTMAPDGKTLLALTGRQSVVLTLPAEGAVPERTIESDAVDAKGERGRGLTRAQFTGNVEYREKGANLDREASSTTLDVVLKPAMAGIQEARFAHRVHFFDGKMTSDSAAARYDLDKGILELTGTEPGLLRPRVVHDQMAVDATRIDVTLAGPQLKGTGAVKSAVQSKKGAPAPRGTATATETRVPSMFKQDTPVNVTADALDYNGTANKATYTGNAQLWQEDTSLKGATIVLDDKTGDLTVGGNVTSVTVRAGEKKTERVRWIGTAMDFRYEEAAHRATYTGNAHLNSTDGDVTAPKIELYFQSSGNDLDRIEAYEDVTLRDQNHTTTGTHLKYTTADERYVVTGTPVRALDECRRETIGRTLTYLKSAETITIDGNEQTRTQTKGNAQCP